MPDNTRTYTHAYVRLSQASCITMYVCMYVCMHAYMYVCMYCIHVCMYTYIHICIQTHTHTHTYVHTYPLSMRGRGAIIIHAYARAGRLMPEVLIREMFSPLCKHYALKLCYLRRQGRDVAVTVRYLHAM